MKSNPKKQTPKTKRPNGQNEAFATILYEKFQSDTKLIIEKVDSLEGTFDAKLNELKADLKTEIQMSEFSLRREFKTDVAELKTNLSDVDKRLTKEIKELKVTVDEVKTIVNSTNEKLTRKTDDHEVRIVKLEDKILTI